MSGGVAGRASLVVMAPLVAGLAGCATGAGLIGFGKETPAQQAERCAPGVEQRPLERWSSISGNLLLRASAGEAGALPGAGATAGGEGRVRLVSPVSVAAAATDVYIADAGQRTVFKFDRGTQTVRVFAQVPTLGTRTDLALDRALSLYLADPAASQVLQYDLTGRVEQIYRNATELPQPITVAVDDGRGEVLVGDQLSARILVFNRLGGVVRPIGAGVGGLEGFRSIADMALRVDQLYVSDPNARTVHALSPSGTYRYGFGDEDLTTPGAVATDAYDRVYVADADATIKVFRGGRLEAVVGAAGDPGRLRFQQISDLWSSDDLLYVADPASASVEVLRIVPPCP